MKLSLFYLLGFIKNYSGGFSVDENIYQRVSFVDDDFKISEQKKIIFDKLVRFIEKTLEESSVSNDIIIEYWDDEKGAIIYSKNLVAIICDFYKLKDSYVGGNSFVLDEYMFDEFDRRNENSFSYKQRIEFLHGAFDSNGNSNKLYFYNDN